MARNKTNEFGYLISARRMTLGYSQFQLGKLMKVVPEVAKIKGVGESGYRSVVNTGPDSAATVGHLHVHILGGTKMGRFTFEGSQRLDG